MAQIGYKRVSSEGQNTDRQLDNIKLDKVFDEKISAGAAHNRMELQNCIDYIREGDVLHVHSIDRLARNLCDLQSIVSRINAKGVTVQFHKENLIFSSDSSSPMNNLLFQIMGAFAEFERAQIRERQQEGINKAISKGIRFGAAPKFTSAQIEEVKLRRLNGESVISLAKAFDVSRQTIYSMLQK